MSEGHRFGSHGWQSNRITIGPLSKLTSVSLWTKVSAKQTHFFSVSFSLSWPRTIFVSTKLAAYVRFFESNIGSIDSFARWFGWWDEVLPSAAKWVNQYPWKRPQVVGHLVCDQCPSFPGPVTRAGHGKGETAYRHGGGSEPIPSMQRSGCQTH